LAVGVGVYLAIAAFVWTALRTDRERRMNAVIGMALLPLGLLMVVGILVGLVALLNANDPH
jgi:hypothetical protein